MSSLQDLIKDHPFFKSLNNLELSSTTKSLQNLLKNTNIQPNQQLDSVIDSVVNKPNVANLKVDEHDIISNDLADSIKTSITATSSIILDHNSLKHRASDKFIFPELVSTIDHIQDNPDIFASDNLYDGSSDTFFSRMIIDNRNNLWILLPPNHPSQHVLAMIDLSELEKSKNNPNYHSYLTQPDFVFYFDLVINHDRVSTSTYDTISLNKVTDHALLSNSHNAHSTTIVFLPDMINAIYNKQLEMQTTMNPYSHYTLLEAVVISTLSPIVKASFHPLSPFHVCILREGNVFELYDPTTDPYAPEQTYILNSLPVGRSKCIGLTEDEDGEEDKDKESSHHDISRQEGDFVSFTFGSFTLPYSFDTFTIYFLTKTGKIAYLSPVVPHGASLPVSAVLELRQRYCKHFLDMDFRLMDVNTLISSIAWLDLVFDIIPVSPSTSGSESSSTAVSPLLSQSSTNSFAAHVRGEIIKGFVLADINRYKEFVPPIDSNTTLLSLVHLPYNVQTHGVPASVQNCIPYYSYSHIDVVQGSVPTIIRLTGHFGNERVSPPEAAGSHFLTHLYTTSVASYSLVAPALHPVVVNYIMNLIRYDVHCYFDLMDVLTQHFDISLLPPTSTADIITNVTLTNQIVAYDSHKYVLSLPPHISTTVEHVYIPFVFPKHHSSTKLWNATIDSVTPFASLIPDIIQKKPQQVEQKNPLSMNFQNTSKSSFKNQYTKTELQLVSDCVSHTLLHLRRIQRQHTQSSISTVNTKANNPISLYVVQNLQHSLAYFFKPMYMQHIFKEYPFIFQTTGQTQTAEMNQKSSSLSILYLTFMAIILAKPIASATSNCTVYSLTSQVISQLNVACRKLCSVEEQSSKSEATMKFFDISQISLSEIGDVHVECTTGGRVSTDVVQYVDSIFDSPLLSLLNLTPQKYAHFLANSIVFNNVHSSAVLANRHSTPLMLLLSSRNIHIASLPSSYSSSLNEQIDQDAIRRDLQLEDVVLDPSSVTPHPYLAQFYRKKHNPNQPISMTVKTTQKLDTLGSDKKEKDSDVESFADIESFLDLYSSSSNSKQITPIAALKARMEDIKIISSIKTNDIDEIMEYRNRINGIYLHCLALKEDIIARTKVITSVGKNQCERALQAMTYTESIANLYNHENSRMDNMIALQSQLNDKLSTLQAKLTNIPTKSEVIFRDTLLALKNQTDILQKKTDNILLFKKEVENASNYDEIETTKDIKKASLVLEKTDEVASGISQSTQTICDISSKLSDIKEHLRLKAIQNDTGDNKLH